MTAPNKNPDPGRVQIQAGEATLEGSLQVPDEAEGLVLFAHGSGSSRHSPRNQFVAEQLRNDGLATLLFDLLTAAEDEIDRRTRELRFNIPLLAERLADTTEWVLDQPQAKELRIGYFGASTGSAAALIAARKRRDTIHAVVSRGGRPDLAQEALPDVQAPTLLIVGGNDAPVIRMNEQALGLLNVERELEIVPGATHLFEEPGALEEVARLAGQWFQKHLTG